MQRGLSVVLPISSRCVMHHLTPPNRCPQLEEALVVSKHHSKRAAGLPEGEEEADDGAGGADGDGEEAEQAGKNTVP